MPGLGYKRYGAAGGDWGAVISPEVGRVDPDHVIGVHVNAMTNTATATSSSDLDPLSPADRVQAEANQQWW